jgi:hypothetical protein
MRYKIVACILILSAFSFVLAAPVQVLEIREACADAVEGDEGVIIVSGKRAPAPRGFEGDSDTWAPSSSQTPPVPDGSHPGVGMPSSPSTGSTSPLSSTPGGTEAEGALKPETTTGSRPASPSKPKSVSWADTVQFFEPDPILPPDRPPGREGYLAKVAKQPPSPEIEHISPNYFSPPPKPQPKGFISKLKTVFSKLGKLTRL